jgi:hypothetical protein
MSLADIVRRIAEPIAPMTELAGSSASKQTQVFLYIVAVSGHGWLLVHNVVLPVHVYVIHLSGILEMLQCAAEADQEECSDTVASCPCAVEQDPE